MTAWRADIDGIFVNFLQRLCLHVSAFPRSAKSRPHLAKTPASPDFSLALREGAGDDVEHDKWCFRAGPIEPPKFS
jgi:hypothetical protein